MHDCGPHMLPARTGHVARTDRTCGPDMRPGRPDMWPRTARTCGPDGPDTWPGHVARTAGATRGPDEDGADRWPGQPVHVARRQESGPGWVLRGKCRVGGFGWLIFEVLGVFMDLYGFDFLALRG